MRDYRNKAVALRKQGKTYSEIRVLIPEIPKSTLSNWLSGLELSEKQKDKLSRNVNRKLVKARARSILVMKNKRDEYFSDIQNSNSRFISLLNNNKSVAKLVLASLYLGEGTKSTRGSLRLGNSDPGIIKLFLKLLRSCYIVDETKFRGTVLCRADQDIKNLNKFWVKTSGINKKQFYKARIDSRTIGKPSHKLDYKGVFVIDYFSASVYHDLLTLGRMMSK
ncbi:MAG: hypothetical protein Q8P69_01045 [bacterium]|nr:hypothetical protein [bacterium]